MNTRAGDEWELFADQCRRQMQRPMSDRLKYGFYRQHKPVLDDAPYRTFATTAEYRKWCHENVPAYLGYRIAEG